MDRPPTRILLVMARKNHHQRSVIAAIGAAARHQGNLRLRLIEQVASPDLDRAAAESSVIIFQARRLWPDEIPRITDLGRPVVNIGDSGTVAGAPEIDCDHRAIGRLAAEHLLGTGAPSLAFASTTETTFIRERLAGFTTALHAAGRRVDANFLRPWQHFAPGASSLVNWLKELPRPCAVFVPLEYESMRLAEAADQAGRRLGEDLLLLGTGDDESRALMTPVPISTVCLMSARIGELALEAAVQLAAGRHPPARTLLPPLGVRVRESTDSCCAADPIVAQALRLIAGARGPTTVAALARAVGVTTRTLELHFRALLGRSPRAEMHRRRHEKVRQLAAATDLSAAAIARRTGFASVQRLHAQFLVHEGMSLREFSRRFRSTTDAAD